MEAGIWPWIRLETWYVRNLVEETHVMYSAIFIVIDFITVINHFIFNFSANNVLIDMLRMIHNT